MASFSALCINGHIFSLLSACVSEPDYLVFVSRTFRRLDDSTTAMYGKVYLSHLSNLVRMQLQGSIDEVVLDFCCNSIEATQFDKLIRENFPREIVSVSMM